MYIVVEASESHPRTGMQCPKKLGSLGYTGTHKQGLKGPQGPQKVVSLEVLGSFWHHWFHKCSPFFNTHTHTKALENYP